MPALSYSRASGAPSAAPMVPPAATETGARSGAQTPEERLSQLQAMPKSELQARRDEMQAALLQATLQELEMQQAALERIRAEETEIEEALAKQRRMISEGMGANTAALLGAEKAAQQRMLFGAGRGAPKPPAPPSSGSEPSFFSRRAGKEEPTPTPLRGTGGGSSGASTPRSGKGRPTPRGYSYAPRELTGDPATSFADEERRRALEEGHYDPELDPRRAGVHERAGVLHAVSGGGGGGGGGRGRGRGRGRGKPRESDEALSEVYGAPMPPASRRVKRNDGLGARRPEVDGMGSMYYVLGTGASTQRVKELQSVLASPATELHWPEREPPRPLSPS